MGMSELPKPREVDGWTIAVAADGAVVGHRPGNDDRDARNVMMYAQGGKPVFWTAGDDGAVALSVVRAVLEMWEEMQE